MFNSENINLYLIRMNTGSYKPYKYFQKKTVCQNDPSKDMSEIILDFYKMHFEAHIAEGLGVYSVPLFRFLFRCW